MANVYTYARLSAPPMFSAADGGEVIFTLECSEDIVGSYGTFIVEGYDDGKGHTGISKEIHIYESEAGAGIIEIPVAVSELAAAPGDDETVPRGSGKAKARVDIKDINGEVVFKSNEVYVDMLIMRERDLFIANTPLKSTGSTFTVYSHYVPRHDYGISGSVGIASYRYFLYDERRVLINDSGELTDWNSDMYTTSPGYTFRGLEDGKRYYITLKVTLGGGYTLYRKYEQLDVEYGDIPGTSERMKLKNIIGGVKITLEENLTHTHIVFSRAEQSVNEYLTLGSIYDSNDTADFTDRYAVPKKKYIYCAAVYNEDVLIETLYGTIEHISNCITVSDALGSYSAVGNITKAPINRNDRGNILEAMDSVFPYNIINGSPDYDSGTVSGVFTPVEDCAPVMDNTDHSNILRKWLNNGRAKLLTYYTGEAWIAAVSDISTTDPDNDDVYVTEFGWTQIGDAEVNTEYVRLGIIEND